ncbi:MAG: hypothetical protein RI955_608 [Bacteroidota bacterium]
MLKFDRFLGREKTIIYNPLNNPILFMKQRSIAIISRHKKLLLFYFVVFLSLQLIALRSKAQGVGINTLSPKSTLDINGSTGFKIDTIVSSMQLDSMKCFVVGKNASNILITLPSASKMKGRYYLIKKNGAGNITVMPSSGNSIDGNSMISLSNIGQVASIISDGVSRWIIISNQIVSNTVSSSAAASSGTTTTTTSSSGWGLTGNTGIVDGSNFIGTTTSIPLTFKVNNIQSARIDNTNNNTFFGFQSGAVSNAAMNNTFIGSLSGATNTANGNTFVGFKSGTANTTGGGNSFVGTNSGMMNKAGNYNASLGFNSLQNNNSGNNNTAVGFSSMLANTGGSGNTTIGYGSLQVNRIGSNNTVVGQQALDADSSSNNQISIGSYTNKAIVGGSSNIFIGNNIDNGNGTTKYSGITNSLMIGHNSGYNNQASNNIFLGNNAGYNNTTGTKNIFVGYQSGNNSTTGSNNNFDGYQSGYSNTSGTDNAAFGFNSLFNNTAGNQNTAFGKQSLNGNTSGNLNAADGAFALYSNSTGNNNTANGANALYGNTSGSNNAALGYNAGSSNTSGNNNTFIGSGANASGTLTNATAIGYNAVVSNSNSIVLGNGANVGIGTSSPTAPLHIFNGNLLMSNSVGTMLLMDNTTGTLNIGGGNQDGDLAVKDMSGNLKNYLTATSGVANYFNNGGNFGMGTTTPASALHVVKNDLGKSIVNIQNTNASGLSAIDFTTSTSTLGMSVGFGNSSCSGIFTNKSFINTNNSDLIISKNGTTADVTLSAATGMMGVSTSSPKSTLDVNGSFGANITVATTAVALTQSNYTVILSNATANVTLPAAAANANRVYHIVNNSGSARTITGYIAIGGLTQTTVANSVAIVLQSNGTNWYQIQ